MVKKLEFVKLMKLNLMKLNYPIKNILNLKKVKINI